MGRRGFILILVILLLTACTKTVVVREPAEQDADENAAIDTPEEELPTPQEQILGPVGLVVCIADADGIRCEHSTNLSGIPLSPLRNGPPYAYAMQGCADPGVEWSCTGRFVAQGNDELPFPASAWRHPSNPPEGNWWCMTVQANGVVESVTCGNADFFQTAPQPGETVYEMGGCSIQEFDGTTAWSCRGTLFRSG